MLTPETTNTDEQPLTELTGGFRKTTRPPKHIAVRAGDKVWVNRKTLRLQPDKELSNESVEVIEVVEK